MMKALMDRIIRMLANRLINDAHYKNLLRKVISEHYSNETLKLHRVWGKKSNLIVGKKVHLNNAVINTVSGKVDIQDYAFLGHNVSLLTGSHNYDVTNIDRHSQVPQKGNNILIEQGAWLASNVTIIGPCTIGQHAVIAAGSVVTKDVEPYTLYAGVPAKFVKPINRSNDVAK